MTRGVTASTQEFERNCFEVDAAPACEEGRKFAMTRLTAPARALRIGSHCRASVMSGPRRGDTGLSFCEVSRGLSLREQNSRMMMWTLSRIAEAVKGRLEEPCAMPIG